MFSDSRMQTTPDVGGLNYFPSDYGDGLGLLESNNSCLYTDWLNSEQEVGRISPSFPVIIEGPAIPQDDFWNELLANTPTASPLPHLKVKAADSSVNNVSFNGAPLQALAAHEVCFSSKPDMFDVGMIPHGGAEGERRGNGAAGSHTILGMQSIHVQSKNLQVARVIPSSFEQFDDTADILEDDEANFITTGAIDGASTEESKSLVNSLLNPSIEDKNKPTSQTTGTENAAWQEHSKRSSAEAKRMQDQHFSEQQPLPAAPPSSSSKARNTHSNSASQTAKESRWAEQLLSSCASAISSRNIVRTQHLMWVLNDLASLAGDANQRLAAYGLKALFSKITGSVSAASAHQRHPAASITPKSINHALLKFYEVNPLHQFVYTLTNALLIESLEAKPRLHVIDIGVSQGTQWPTFIEAMATRSCGTPELLRLTIVDDPQGTPFRSTTQEDDSSSALKIKLERFAKVIGINLQLQIITIPLEDLTPEVLSLKSDETLAICAQFRLHRLMETSTDQADDSSCGSNTKLCPRDRFLKLLHDLSPELMVLNDNDVDQLATDFMVRFNRVTEHHWRFLDSMSASFKGRDCEERQTIEQELAMALLNNVACEGWAREERNDCHAGWCVRMRAAGFRGRAPTEDAIETVRVLLRKYDSNWDFLLDDSCAVLHWKQQPMTFCSVWT